ncbi:MAG: transglutaminase-like domain-containing protein [Luteolibacter sp.]|nr:transglutaminase-like domain-containing protein [Luteolibacter sp.]
MRHRLALIRTWFHKDFHYTRNLTIQHPPYRVTGPTPIARFLTQTRSGHCEYFATAAILMLREAGIPARYATGYAVMERDTKRDGFVIRGTHGHAWCRVWDQQSGLWLDFDPTPPDWLANISSQPPWTQRLADQLKRLREDFFLWRNRSANRMAVSLIMLAAGIAGAGFITKRLWRTKHHIAANVTSPGYEGPVIRTPLHGLEARARRQLGARPPGRPFGCWLAELRPSLPDAPALDEAIALHQRLRFDPAPPEPADQERLTRLTGELEAAIRHRAVRR